MRRLAFLLLGALLGFVVWREVFTVNDWFAWWLHPSIRRADWSLPLAYKLWQVNNDPQTLDADGLIVMQDFHSDGFNIQDGYRFTPETPARYANTLYLFGNSTAYGWGDLDTETINYFLQQTEKATRVANRAIPGDTIAVEMDRLELTDLKPGDTVVFLDGAIPPYADVTPAREYSVAHGARFYQFSQPSALFHTGTALTVPSADFIDKFHLNSDGNKLIAQAIADAIGSADQSTARDNF